MLVTEKKSQHSETCKALPFFFFLLGISGEYCVEMFTVLD